MADYITADEFKERVGIGSAKDDVRIAEHVSAASLMVDQFCGRRFDADTVATARVFHAYDAYSTLIDDALEITQVATDDADNAGYSTVWAAADYQTYPLNGVGINRQGGWPITEIVAVENRVFPVHRRPAVEVTAKWGWAATPQDVVEATYLIAHKLYYERDVPSGIVPGSQEFGGAALREIRSAYKLLGPYKRTVPVIGG
jgi:hypothetical protein